ncbi:(2Fe-2S)-binding protein [Pseudonocardia endophytica]|uniref:Ferric iron reductase FhuF-like transporter n=1 Tax=Pseudonocardia endophytica TaxID=401976 RepID=A0A4R1HH15_PSEEN|nr:(2Fe-2S)-binding protein [Pseudonocardia endophytica]TCK21018.1 ferric iron reductase FhuF-like transporter [Pseudonocardia endophytica]
MPTDTSRAGVGSVLADVALLGPFFELATPGTDDRDDWVPFARLHTDPGPLGERIARVAAALGAGERVAASIAFQGLVARLVAAPLAAVVLHGVLPATDDLSRRPGADDPWAPGLPEVTGVRTPDPVRDPDGAAALLSDGLVDGLVAPLVDAVRSLVPVSAHVLWGNVASSLSGAGRVLDPARPGARPALLGVLAGLMDRAPLAGTGRLLRLEEDRPDTEWGFRRRSCCLYYRVPGGGLCGDCVLQGRR